MRRHKLNWIWIILLGLFVGSCEDYLDRSPDDGLSEDDVYKDYSSLLGFMDRIFQNDDILIFTHGINSYSNTYVTVGNLSDEYASVRTIWTALPMTDFPKMMFIKIIAVC